MRNELAPNWATGLSRAFWQSFGWLAVDAPPGAELCLTAIRPWPRWLSWPASATASAGLWVTIFAGLHALGGP
jgi:hypothetical protein